ncbi:LAME_0D10638g1_1 [Lachancea meyersii CBS 8951]|uniref:LAME_0D10638g1_1 n=1 Tax=Lachancea meyersii CBS 8951 TaxID=1266667 RepID=A0A1G4JBW9_9SACH|nr:LAME_0D10638g1_1 [Lachancea meyersii CBS 8951]
MPYHLPVLLNPLVNAVFNCPTPHTSALRKVFSQIAKRRFLLVAPDTETLTEYEDLETGQLLPELCYTHEFVADHIVMLDSRDGMPVDEFRTLSGKTIVVRNQQGTLLTGTGFDTRRRCRILEARLLTNFNDYLEGSSSYPVIHVDFPFTGRLARRDEWQLFKSLKPVASREKNVEKSSKFEYSTKETISLEQMLRINPTHADQLSVIFETERKLLTSFKYNANVLASHFAETCEKAFEVINKDPNFQHLPNVQMHVHEYVELSLYDDFWAQLTNSMKAVEIEALSDYNLLRNISISQVPSFLYPMNNSKFDLRFVTQVEQNLLEAVDCLRKLSSTNCHSAKAKVIVDTLQTLSRTISVDGMTIPIDADTLVSLLVVTVCRAGVKDLKSHLFYLQEFAKDSVQITFGVLAYGMSTLEAVLSYFDVPEKVHSLEHNGRMNLEFWSWLSNLDASVKAGDPQDLEKMIQVRTSSGQSSLAFCIQEKQERAFEHLINNYEAQVPLEDLLHDQNVEGSNLLIQMLDGGCYELADKFVDMLCLNCTKRELKEFLNRSNRYGRTSGHYLMHAPDLIKKLGIFLNWEKQDCNGQTPLFAVIRAYDQPSYEDMFMEAYNWATEWCKLQRKVFRSSLHTDTKGNSLLHVVRSNASFLLNDASANVNATNKNGLTPLMVYAKYNRLDNVKCIIKDRRLILEKCQEGTYLNCFDFFKNPTVLREMGKQPSSIACLPLKLILARSIKCENNEWVVWMTCRSKGSTNVVMRPLRFIQNLLLLYWKAYPRTFLPLEEFVNELHELCKLNILVLYRLQAHVFLRKLSIMLSIILQESIFADAFHSSDLNISQHIGDEGNRDQSKEDSGLIEPDQMTSIQRVLKFNRSEMMLFRARAHILKKLSASAELKETDLTKAHQLLAKRVNLFFNSFEHCGEMFPDLTFLRKRPDCGSIASSLNFLQRCTEVLIANIDKALNVDLPKWWHAYGELAASRHEYQKHFPDSVRPNGAASSGLFRSYIETKRSKLADTISTKIKRNVNYLTKVGWDIKQENERLAVEVNNFLMFKNEFWTILTVREHTELNIQMLQEHLICLEESLLNYTEQFNNEHVNNLHRGF